MYGQTYICDHPVYSHCTLYKIGEKGLAVIQQRYIPETKSTYWTEIDPWLVDALYLHEGFKKFFDERSGECADGLYPTTSMPKFTYKGPVMEFNTLLADSWEGETVAPSEKKARSNLTYQFKKRNNRIAGSRITLPGKIMMVD